MSDLDRGFVKRWTITLFLIVTFVALVALASDVLFILFAGVLVALFFDRIIRTVNDKTGLPRKAALAILLALLVGITVLAGLWMLPRLSDQFDQLATELPKRWAQVEEWLRQWSWGQSVLDSMSRPGEFIGDHWQGLSGFVAALIGLVAGMMIALVLGTYFVIAPGLYTGGLLKTLPDHCRGFGGELFCRWHQGLGNWILAKLASMLIIAVLVGIGLWIIGIPLVLINAVLSGLLSFVPNFGPIASVIPPVLLALGQDATLVLWVIGLYIVVQALEGYLITPNIMRFATRLPQAMILATQLLFGVLFGLAGLIFAVPLGLTIMVAVQTWIERRDGEGASEDCAKQHR